MLNHLYLIHTVQFSVACIGFRDFNHITRLNQMLQNKPTTQPEYALQTSGCVCVDLMTLTSPYFSYLNSSSTEQSA